MGNSMNVDSIAYKTPCSDETNMYLILLKERAADIAIERIGKVVPEVLQPEEKELSKGIPLMWTASQN